MRIITARFAPVDRWCGVKRMRDVHGRFHLLAGMAIQLDADRLYSDRDSLDSCGGREWVVTDESRAAVGRALGKDEVGELVCEHQLELGD